MDKDKLRQFLSRTEERGIAALYNKGYQWIQSNFLPHVHLADTLLETEVELLADCWYLMGDIYDFNDAPKKAIECYFKALECDEEADGAYREIGLAYQQIGDYTKALEYTELALAKMPDDEDLMDIKAEIQDYINYNHSPHWDVESSLFILNEKLSNEAFDEVIAMVSAMETPETYHLTRLARAYGAKDERALYLETWKKIMASGEVIQFDCADCFYMPWEVYTSSEIWTLLKGGRGQIDTYDFMQFESLFEHYEEQLSDSEILGLIFDYYTYKATKEYKKLNAFAKQYPKWEEVQRR